MDKINFNEFIKRCFNTVSPGCRYYNNWHIQVIADRLQALFLGKIKRLIINMPPRSMKSICVSVAWPAWILGMNAQAKIIVASYSQILSEKLSLDTRCIIQSEWYQELFPEVKLAKDQNTKSKFLTTQRGGRFATSVGGTITGEGGDFLIADDPLSPMQAASEKFRNRACQWFDQTFMTRLNNRKKGSVVVVMHRLHSEDLTNHLISKAGSNWHLLSLPVISEKKQTIYSITTPYIIKKNQKKKRNVIYTRKSNEILCSKLLSYKEIEHIKIDLGTQGFLAQYQQSPISYFSGFIKYEWFNRYKKLPEKLDFITHSWDTASTSSTYSDFSVCTIWGQLENMFYIIDVYRAKLEYPDLKKQVIKLAECWSIYAILIEGKASGLQLIQELKSITTLPIISITPTQNKLARFYQVIPIIESKRIFLPYNALWLSDFEQEIMSFPNTKHDDQIDSMTQYLSWIKNKATDNLQIKYL